MYLCKAEHILLHFSPIVLRTLALVS